ncbi:hypothetical protein NFI96_033783, partial [Prochilodus magdalenae]
MRRDVERREEKRREEKKIENWREEKRREEKRRQEKRREEKRREEKRREEKRREEKRGKEKRREEKRREEKRREEKRKKNMRREEKRREEKRREEKRREERRGEERRELERREEKRRKENRREEKRREEKRREEKRRERREEGGGSVVRLNSPRNRGSDGECVYSPCCLFISFMEPVEQSNDVALDIIITNVVSVFRTRCHLNLRTIGLEGNNVIYKPEVGKVLMKLRKPRITASIWSSGKIICTGATSEDEAKLGARRLARCLQKIGFKVRFSDFKVVNVLAVCSMPFQIRLIEFTKNNRPIASYEPEIHPAASYRIKNLRATVQVFSTGNITVTGKGYTSGSSLCFYCYSKRVLTDPEQMSKMEHHKAHVQTDARDARDSGGG